MEKHFVLEPRDLLRFNVFVLFSQRPKQGFMFLIMTVVMFLNLIVRSYRQVVYHDENAGELAFFALFCGGLVFAVYVIIRKTYKTEGIGGQYLCAVQEEGVLYQTPISKSLIYWHMIKSYDVKKDYIYLMTGDMSGIVLPKRAFASDEEVQAFLAHVQDSYQASQQRSLPKGKREKSNRFFRGCMFYLLIFLLAVGIVNYLTHSK